MSEPSQQEPNRQHRSTGFGFFLIELKESFLMALDSLSAHKLRSLLTLTGILIGVFSIIVVMTVVRIMERNAESSLSQLGPNTFSIQKMPAILFEGPEEWQNLMRRENITLEMGNALKDRAFLPASIGMETQLNTSLARSDYEETNPDVQMLGVTPEAFAAKNWVVEFGRGLMAPDMDGSRLVCVLGSSLAEKLFPNSQAVGQEVKFDGIGYRVIGVLESKGQVLGGDQDNFLAVPLTTGMNRYGWMNRSLSILVQAQDTALLEETKEEARGILRTLRKVEPGAKDDFEIFSNDSLIAQFRQVTLAVRAAAAAISSIALLAAGVGIMNIMLVSVTERTREIGIRRAIGARKRTILTQFILEAIVLCQFGGVAGILLGLLGGNMAGLALSLPVTIPLDWTLFGFVICSIVGIVFGTYPAFKAANLDPVESLRYE